HSPNRDADPEEGHCGRGERGEAPQEHDRPRLPTTPAGLDGCPHGVARHDHRRLIVVARQISHGLSPLLFGDVVVLFHAIHSPAKSASAVRSFALARDSCAFDVPDSMPSTTPISSCVYPSTSCITNTARYPSGSASIARAIRSFRSGSLRAPFAGSVVASTALVSRCRSRLTDRSPFNATDTPIECSHVENDDRRLNVPIRSNAR